MSPYVRITIAIASTLQLAEARTTTYGEVAMLKASPLFGRGHIGPSAWRGSTR